MLILATNYPKVRAEKDPISRDSHSNKWIYQSQLVRNYLFVIYKGTLIDDTLIAMKVLKLQKRRLKRDLE